MALNVNDTLRLTNLGRIGCRVYNDADISIDHATLTALTFNTELFDVGSMHSTAANTDRLTCPVTGVYVVTGHVSFQTGTTGVRHLYIRLNGTNSLAIQETNALGAGVTVLSVSTLFRFTALDYVQLLVFHTQGSAISIISTRNYSPEFAAYLIGR